MANEFNDLNKEIAELTALQQGLGTKLKDQEKGLKAFTEATVKGAGQLAKGLGSWSKAVGEGDTSFSSLTSVVDIATNALANMAKAIPIVGAGLSQTAKAAGEAGKFMLNQLDTTTKAFNQMGQYAATGVKGMTGLKDQFTGARLPLETLGKIVGENAATFARWKDTTNEGTNAFSEIVGDLTDKGDLTLRRLGMSADQIGQTTAAFITQQTRLGRSQQMTNAELVASTKQYAIDLDQLQKLTGQSAQSIQAQQDKMLSQARFRANIDEMVADGRGNFATRIQNLQTEFSGFSDEMGQGVADLVSGTSEMGTAGGKLMASTGGVAMDIIQRTKEGKLTQAEASIELKKAMQAQQERQRQLGSQIDSASAGTLEYSAVSDAIASLDTGAANRAKNTQKKQLAGSDQLTESTITAQQQMENMNMQIQKLGFEALPHATHAIDSVAVTMEKAIEYVKDTLFGGGVKDEASRAAEVRRSAGAGGAVSTVAGAGGAIVGGAGGEGDGAAIMEAAATAPSPSKTQAGSKETALASSKESKTTSPVAPAGEITKIIETGSGYNIVELADGTKVKRSGNRNWRNNNPGNLNYGELAKSYGAIGSDGRFAIFPTVEMGDKAREGLLFGPSYAGLTIAGAISKYAPPSENDTAKYISEVISAINASPTDVVGKLDAGQRKSMLDVMAKVEGFKSGTVEPVTAATGVVLSGPQQGYNPNTSMSGVDVKPLSKQAVAAAGAANGQASIDPQMFGLQMEQLDLLIASAKNQLAVKQRILKAKS